MPLEEEIAAAEADVSRLKDDLSAANKRRDDLYVRRSAEKFGIEVGMRVRSRGKEFVVDAIQPESWGASRPWLYCREIKKDGSPGNAKRTVYGNWEIVSSQSSDD